MSVVTNAMPDVAAHVARQVHDAARPGCSSAAARPTYESVWMGTKRNAIPTDWMHAQLHRRAEVHAAGRACAPCRRATPLSTHEAERDERTARRPCRPRRPTNGSSRMTTQPSRRERHARLLRGVAHEHLQVLGQEHRRCRRAPRPSMSIIMLATAKLRRLNIFRSTIGLSWLQLPEDERHERHRRDDREADDERGVEPVVLLPLVEHDLEAAEADAR